MKPPILTISPPKKPNILLLLERLSLGILSTPWQLEEMAGEVSNPLQSTRINKTSLRRHGFKALYYVDDKSNHLWLSDGKWKKAFPPFSPVGASPRPPPGARGLGCFFPTDKMYLLGFWLRKLSPIA